MTTLPSKNPGRDIIPVLLLAAVFSALAFFSLGRGRHYSDNPNPNLDPMAGMDQPPYSVAEWKQREARDGKASWMRSRHGDRRHIEGEAVQDAPNRPITPMP